MASIPELKKKLRTEILAKRKSLSPAERTKLSEAVAYSFFQKFPEVLSVPTRIGAFRPIKDEIPLDPLFKKLLEAKCQLFFPKVISDDPPQLKFYASNPFREELWTKERFGLLEPLPHFECLVSELDFVLVPFAVVDSEGNRVGYGKGHYDSALKNKGSAKAVGVGFQFQQVEKVPHEKHDIKLDALVLVS